MINSRHIRVFISSTFQDMQGERDYLMKRSFPKLRALAAQRDVILSEVDLRWGITSEESRTGKVVDICFKEIENSIPFFIGIIGNRYGWVPERKDLTMGTEIRYPAIGKYLDQHLSVTEMEMQFGVLERPEDMHAFFFIKAQEEVPDDLIMLRKLKEAVRASRYPSSVYTSLEDLCGQVEEAFISLLDRLFPEGSLSGHQKEQLVQNSFISRLSTTYIRDEERFDVLSRFVRDGDDSCLVITGDSGMGKSALLANWVKENGNADFDVIPFFCSNGGNQSSSHIIQYLTDEICARYGIEQRQGSRTDTDHLADLLNLLAVNERKTVIVFDAINQIAETGEAKTLKWLPDPPRNVQYIFSTLEDDETMTVFRRRQYKIFRIEALSAKQKRELIEKYLRGFGKSLETKLCGKILDDPLTDNTLVLKSILDELVLEGNFETLSDQLEYYLHCEGISDFYQRVLARFEKDYGLEFVKKILSLISISRTGVTEDELIHITGIRRIDLSEFFYAFATHLCNQSGRFVFTHMYISSSVRERYLEGDPVLERACRASLAEEVRKISGTDSYREVPYQLDKLQDWQGLHDFICKVPFLLFCMESNVFEMTVYWRHILDGSPSGKYSVLDYLDRMDGTEDRIRLFKTLLTLCRNLYATEEQKKLVGMLQDLIKENPALARPDVYLALSESTPRPECLEYVQKSLEISRCEKDIPTEIDSLLQFGRVFYDAACKENDNTAGVKAFEAWDQAKDLAIGLWGEIHPVVMHCYSGMSLTYDCVAPDDWDGSLALARKALDLSLAIYGEKHTLTARPYHYVGVIYREKQMWPEALHYFLKAYELWRPVYGKSHDVIHSSLGNQGKAYYHMGEYEKALACYDENLEVEALICKEDLGYQNALTQLWRARIFKKIGRIEEARRAFEDGRNALDSCTVSDGQGKKLRKEYLEFEQNFLI